MKVELHAARGLVAVSESHGNGTRTIHKYSVERDGRRRGISFAKHANGDLTGIVVQHKQTCTIHDGRVVNVQWEPDPRASRELVEHGAEVELGERDDLPGDVDSEVSV